MRRKAPYWKLYGSEKEHAMSATERWGRLAITKTRKGIASVLIFFSSSQAMTADFSIRMKGYIYRGVSWEEKGPPQFKWCF